MNNAQYKSILKADIDYCVGWLEYDFGIKLNNTFLKDCGNATKLYDEFSFIEKIKNIIKEKDKEKINDFKFKLLSWSIVIKNKNFDNEIEQEIYDRLIESTSEYLNLI